MCQGYSAALFSYYGDCVELRPKLGRILKGVIALHHQQHWHYDGLLVFKKRRKDDNVQHNHHHHRLLLLLEKGVGKEKQVQ